MLNEPSGPATTVARVNATSLPPDNWMLTVSPGMKPLPVTLTASPAFMAPLPTLRLEGNAPILIWLVALRWLVVPVATALTVPSGVLGGTVALKLKEPAAFTWVAPNLALV